MKLVGSTWSNFVNSSVVAAARWAAPAPSDQASPPRVGFKEARIWPAWFEAAELPYPAGKGGSKIGSGGDIKGIGSRTGEHGASRQRGPRREGARFQTAELAVGVGVLRNGSRTVEKKKQSANTRGRNRTDCFFV